MTKINVHNNGTQTHSLPGTNHVIRPGPNHIPIADWEAAKKASKVIDHHVEAKTFTEHKLTAAEKKAEAEIAAAAEPEKTPAHPHGHAKK